MDLLQFEFGRHAILVALLSSVLAGIIGSYVVVRRLVSLSGGIAHAAFGGVGVAVFFGFNPLLGALLMSIASGALISGARRWFHSREDTWIAISWSLGMAIGVLLISFQPGFAPDLFGYLFGNILLVSRVDLMGMGGLAILELLFIGLFYKDVLALSLDEEFYQIQGRPVRTLSVIFLVLISASVVLMMRAVGLLLVLALLTFPAAIAGLFTRRLGTLMLTATGVSVVLSTLGLLVATLLDWVASATIVIVMAVAYAAALVVSTRRSLPH